MATLRWLGASLPVADVWRVVVAGTWATNDTVTLTVGYRSIVVTVGATTTTASIASSLVAAWNGSAYSGDATFSATGNNVPEFAEATAVIGSTTSTVNVTMNTSGVPLGFSCTKSSTSGTVTVTNPTVATGPNYWSDSKNWSTGSAPVDGDTVYIDNNATDILYGLAQSAVQPAAVYIGQSYTGSIGLPETNANGGYQEYRKTYLELGPATLVVGRGAGNGSGRIKINTGTDVCAATVENTGSSLDTLPALLLKGTNASNSLVMNGGSVGVAVFGGEAATLATVKLSGGALTTGSGATLSGTLTVTGGSWLVNSNVATLNVFGGTVQTAGTAAVGAATVEGGVLAHYSTGDLCSSGATTVEGTGVIDLGTGAGAASASNSVLVKGQSATYSDPNGRIASVTFTLSGGARSSQITVKSDATLAVS